MPVLTASLLAALELAADSPRRVAAPGAPCVAICPNAVTNADMATCFTRELRSAEVDLSTYLAEARRIAAPSAGTSDPRESDILLALNRAQDAWARFRDLQCEAEAATWTNGSGRGTAVQWCRLTLTRERARSLWDTHIQGRVTELKAPPVVCPGEVSAR